MGMLSDEETKGPDLIPADWPPIERPVPNQTVVFQREFLPDSRRTGTPEEEGSERRAMETRLGARTSTARRETALPRGRAFFQGLPAGPMADGALRRHERKSNGPPLYWRLAGRPSPERSRREGGGVDLAQGARRWIEGINHHGRGTAHFLGQTGKRVSEGFVSGLGRVGWGAGAGDNPALGRQPQTSTT